MTGYSIGKTGTKGHPVAVLFVGSDEPTGRRDEDGRPISGWTPIANKHGDEPWVPILFQEKAFLVWLIAVAVGDSILPCP